MSVMGLDFGQKTVGVAVSDSMLITAQPLETIVRKSASKLRTTYARLREIIAEHEVEKIVVGNPLNMDGSSSEISRMAGLFADELGKKTGLPVELWDERLTTHEASEVLREGGVPMSDRKKYVDKLAAAIILQGYLDYGNR